MHDHQFKMPPLEWVRAFEAAARCGSFTAAAAETGSAWSAISQRIGHLEKLLGTTLFYRRARSIALTVEGEAWLSHVRLAPDNLRDSSEVLFGSGPGAPDDIVQPVDHRVVDAPRLERLRGIARSRLSV
jgi:LysR family glycine cleavage system transcriptional activator